MIAASTLAGCQSEPTDRTAQPQGNAAEEPSVDEGGNARGPGPDPRDGSQRWLTNTHRDGPWAGYGPPFSEAAFSVRCASGRLIFSTTEMPPSGPGATEMRLAAEGFTQTLKAEANEAGLPNTEASVAADADWLSRLVAASGNLIVTVGGSDPLRVPIADPLRSLIRDCAG